MSGDIIRCLALRCGYGDITVVRNLDLRVSPAEVVLLLGPNGAGKTTALMTIAGLLPKLSGEVEVCGAPACSDRPYLMARRGMSFVPADRALVASLSVKDNLLLAATKRGMPVDEVLDLLPALRPRLSVSAGRISGGEQQMLAVGRALMPRPRALLIDELSTGLAPRITAHLLGTILRMARDTQVGVLLVEQQVNLALSHADRAYLLVHGELRLVAGCAQLRADPARLARAYLGDAPEAAPAGAAGTNVDFSTQVRVADS
jgi:branched-chain amino acid transport system ATP-binding protein